MGTMDEASSGAPAAAESIIPREARRNVLATVLGRPASVGLTLLATLWIIRNLGPERYGVYRIVLTVVTVLDLTLEVSLFAIAVREIAKSREQAADWLGATTVVRGALGVLVALGIALAPLFLHLDSEAAATVRMGALYFLVNSFRTPVSYFRGLLVIHWEMILLTLSRALELGLVILITSAGGGGSQLMGAKAATSALFVAAAWVVVLLHFRLRPRTGIGMVRPLVLYSLPLAVTAALVLGRTQGDILLIGWLLGASAAGAFGAVAQIPDFGSTASSLLMMTTAPLLARHLGRGEEQQFQRVLQRMFDGLVRVLPGLAAVGCLFAHQVVMLAFGPKYAGVIGECRVLIGVACIIPIAELLAVTAIALNLQNRLVKVELVSITITVAGNLILLGAIGTMASAWIRLITYMIGLVLTYAIIRANSAYRLSFRELGPAGLSALAAGAVAGASLALHPIVAAVLGLATYLACLRVLGGWSLPARTGA
jgi:O-antigen/teichoic acid export membrane protein